MKTLTRRTILFLCTHNSARSQMAEGLLRDHFGEHYDVYSAGTVATRVHPHAITVLAALGINTDNHSSKTFDSFGDKKFDIVVTVCDAARESCPIYPNSTRMIHHSFEDPSRVVGSVDQQLEAFRKTRDEISQWIKLEFDPTTSSSP